jgi:two-component system sensor kinase FixL
LNLVANAMEATKEKPKTADITIRSQLFDRNTVRISVIDRGSGVAPERLSKLFEPFFTTKDQGLGLGLAVSQSIIEAHGGRIWARPNPDGGLTVHFTLKTAAENGQSTQA